LTLSNEEIMALVEGYDKESKALKRDSLRMAWYMRGGLSYEETMYLSNSEREMISKIIEDNMDTTKKSGLPFF